MEDFLPVQPWGQGDVAETSMNHPYKDEQGQRGKKCRGHRGMCKGLQEGKKTNRKEIGSCRLRFDQGGARKEETGDGRSQGGRRHVP